MQQLWGLVLRRGLCPLVGEDPPGLLRCPTLCQWDPLLTQVPACSLDWCAGPRPCSFRGPRYFSIPAQEAARSLAGGLIY